MEDGEGCLKEAEVTKNVSLHTTELKEKNIIVKSCRWVFSFKNKALAHSFESFGQNISLLLTPWDVFHLFTTILN